MVVVETEVVVMEKVAVVAPAGTVTEAGTVALDELDVKPTTIPLDPAGPDRVTVPVEDPPPITFNGETVTPMSATGLIVKVAVLLTPA